MTKGGPVDYQPIHYTVVEMDVAGSGGRDDQLQLRMRADLRRIIDDTLARQSLDPRGLYRSDLGDGLRLIVPPTISPRCLIDPFVPNLTGELRTHRKASSPAARLRLRLAVHMGLLHRDTDGGFAGQPLVHSARLLAATPVRRALALADRADLVIVVSQSVYEAVVRHGYALDPDTYQQVDIREKETTATAWIHLPGYPLNPDPVPHSRTTSMLRGYRPGRRPRYATRPAR